VNAFIVIVGFWCPSVTIVSFLRLGSGAQCDHGSRLRLGYGPQCDHGFRYGWVVVKSVDAVSVTIGFSLTYCVNAVVVTVAGSSRAAVASGQAGA
jgi:hypothetical protein